MKIFAILSLLVVGACTANLSATDLSAGYEVYPVVKEKNNVEGK